MKILIPTCLTHEDLIPMVEQLHATIGADDQIIVSCQDGSASRNRNYCLEHAHLTHGEVAIMLDDDISGFYPGWLDDLAKPMSDPLVVAVSARLLAPDGSFGATCSRCMVAEPDEIVVEPNDHCVIPTAAIAFRYRGIMFDERYQGSGWEDNDWFFQYLEQDPDAKFVQSNRCRLVHANEMKLQRPFWKYNYQLFHDKWGHAT